MVCTQIFYFLLLFVSKAVCCLEVLVCLPYHILTILSKILRTSQFIEIVFTDLIQVSCRVFIVELSWRLERKRPADEIQAHLHLYPNIPAQDLGSDHGHHQTRRWSARFIGS
ncbi:hypothetical protein FOCC_FOCC001951 [Frankliniella occidentalis]|nr:hypothetical protein FOCC_FOCC001951 [Frankliniella occidentalis]